MKLLLVRIGYLKGATLGWLIADSMRFATIEEPWMKNAYGPGGVKSRSCAPDGEYKLVPHSGTRFKNVWAFTNPELGVYRWPQDIPAGQQWGRSAMLIHAGNSVNDIEGCIAIGRRHGYEQGIHWVYESRAALEELRRILGNREHTLVIRSTKGTEEDWK